MAQSAQSPDILSPRRGGPSGISPSVSAVAPGSGTSALVPSLGLGPANTGRLRDNGSLTARKSTVSAPQTARANYESALLSAVRRQIESFEEKVGGQISTLRCQQQRDRLREAAFSRLEEKMSSLEGHQPKLDQRLAELTGNFKGLSDEMQAQIRRVDLMDDRLWEWRHHLEEEFRKKYTDFEQSIHKVCSGVRVMASANEEGQKRLFQRVQTLEMEVRERLACMDESKAVEGLHERLEMLEGRCQSLEEQAALEAAHASMINHCERAARDEVEESANAALLGMLERRVSDLAERLEQVHQDARETHGKVAVQEEHHRTMRTLLDAGEERHRVLLDKVDRGDLAGKFEQLQQAAHEDHRLRTEHHERLELLARRLDYQEQAQEELHSSHLRVSREGSTTAATSITKTIEEWQARVEQAEAHLAVLQQELHTMQEEADLGPRVSQLVASLKEVMPKLVEHDHAIQALQERPQESNPPSASGVDVAAGAGAGADAARAADKMQDMSESKSEPGLQDAVKGLQERLSAIDSDALEVRGRLAEHAALLLEHRGLQAHMEDLHQEVKGLSARGGQDAVSTVGEPVSKLAMEEALGVLRREMSETLGESQRSAQAQLQEFVQLAASSQEAAKTVLAELLPLKSALEDSTKREVTWPGLPNGAELHEELLRCTRTSAEGRELAAGVLGEFAALRRGLRPVAGASVENSPDAGTLPPT
uniref:Uncharacterized protein n=1 Tax=Alexandrium monilatum TaxID=311494 RepID=A0A7S4UBT1_9DINO